MSTFSKKRRYGHAPITKKDSGLMDVRQCNFYVASLVDNFLNESHADGSVTITSDITMLFNQQRLDKMSAQALVSHFDSMQQKNDSLRQLRSKLSDEQLASLVKSRYIQSPSELMAYSTYLVSEMSRLDGDVKQLMQQQLQQTDVPKDSEQKDTSTSVS